MALPPSAVGRLGLYQPIRLGPLYCLIIAIQLVVAKYININRDTPRLLPPDLRDEVPTNHLVHFVINAMEAIDVSAAPVNERGTGGCEQYPSRMLLGLLTYNDATGVFFQPPDRTPAPRIRSRAAALRRHPSLPRHAVHLPAQKRPATSPPARPPVPQKKAPQPRTHATRSTPLG